MTPKDGYLVLYNLACCLGWFGVLVVSFLSLTKNVSSMGIIQALASIYNDDNNTFIPMSLLLAITQIAAVMEIIHAAIGFVRSPVMITGMQVSSRLVALFAIYYSTNAQDQWGAGLMMISWASTEVPRYAFYIAALLTGDATKKTPYPLFWLRYSLFAILYPTGIIGELTVFYAAAKDLGFITKFPPFVGTIYYPILQIVYVFGSPVMIMNMVTNRKSAFKKRFARPPPPPRGLSWPVTDNSTTPQPTRGSTETNVAILVAALEAASKEKAAAAQKDKRKWRFAYWKHIRSIVEEQCKSPEAALAIAQAGLTKAYSLFEFIAPDGSAVTLQEALSAKNSESFYTGSVKGQGRARITKFEVPYKGKTLSGQELKDQVSKWVSYGTIEPSAGKAICDCVDHPEWIEQTVANKYFVLLGAGSAMGPLHVLLAMGANVIAIDLDRAPIWKRLISLTKQSSGSITFPLSVDPKTIDPNDEDALCAAAGCNLFTHTPMIRDWLLQLKPGAQFVVGCYAYLDGALHVQVSLAMDAIVRDLTEKRPNTSVAYLCTPTDLHLIPKEAHDAALAHYKEFSKKPYCMFAKLLNKKFLTKNAQQPFKSSSGEQFYYVNGISVAQGPNYILAKRMQHWRAVIARSKGCIVSSNIAPSTSTASVVHNRTFAWAYEGMPYFTPYEIFAPETSNAVMSAILLYDLNEPTSVGNPTTKLSNPNQLFSYGSFHGGVWRCAYEINSIGEASVLLYFSRLAAPYLYSIGVASAAIAACYYNS